MMTRPGRVFLFYGISMIAFAKQLHFRSASMLCVFITSEFRYPADAVIFSLCQIHCHQ